MSDRFIKITRCGDCPNYKIAMKCTLTGDSVEFGEVDENCPLDIFPDVTKLKADLEHWQNAAVEFNKEKLDYVERYLAVVALLEKWEVQDAKRTRVDEAILNRSAAILYPGKCGSCSQRDECPIHDCTGPPSHEHEACSCYTPFPAADIEALMDDYRRSLEKASPEAPAVVDNHPTECKCAGPGGTVCPHMADWPNCTETAHGCPHEPLMKPLYGPRCLGSVEDKLTEDRMNSEGCDGRKSPNGVEGRVCSRFVSPDEFVCPGCYGKRICRTGPHPDDFVKCARCDGKHKLRRGVDE